jgi:hypothetical protein
MKQLHAHPPSQPQSDNLFEINRMRNRGEREDSLKSRLTACVLNNITGSRTKDIAISSRLLPDHAPRSWIPNPNSSILILPPGPSRRPWPQRCSRSWVCDFTPTQFSK